MALQEPTYRSVSVGMVKVAIRDNDNQIIANVIGNNVIAIDEHYQRATVTGPDRAGVYGIGEYVYFTNHKNHNETVPVDELNIKVAN